MIKTVLLVTFLFGAAIADLKDFPNVEAFFISQEWNHSLLEPPKESYETIAKDLEEIRKTFPQLAHIKYNPQFEHGKIMCNKEIDLKKVNSSSYGPIKAQYIGNDEYIITFNKPYSSRDIGMELVTRYIYPREGHRYCNSLMNLDLKTNIIRSQLPGNPIYYLQEIPPNFSVVQIPEQKIWTLAKKDGKFIIQSN